MHPYRGGLTGNKPLNQVFKSDKLNECRIMAINIDIGMREFQWQLGFLHLFWREWTGKEDLNKTFKPDTTNSCRTIDVQFRTITLKHLYHPSKL